MIDDLPFREVPGSIDAPALTFYSLATCHICRKARDYLEDRGYAYRYVYVDELPSQTRDHLKGELSARHGTRLAFPALEIEESRIVLGFFRRAWDDALHCGSADNHG